MTDIDRLLNEYRRCGVLIDSDLLTVFLVGNVDRSHVGVHPGTAGYRPEDYDAIAAILEDVPGRIITTPSILTEVSNRLLDPGSTPARRAAYAEAFRGFLLASQEHRWPTEELAAMPAFVDFGLADVSIQALAFGQYLVLTSDEPLAALLRSNGVDVLDLAAVRAGTRSATEQE